MMVDRVFTSIPCSRVLVANTCPYGIINMFNIGVLLRVVPQPLTVAVQRVQYFSSPTTPVGAGGVYNTFATVNKPLKINF